MESKKILLALAVIFIALAVGQVTAVQIKFWNSDTAWFNETGDLNISGKMFCIDCIDSEDIENNIIGSVDMSSEFNTTYNLVWIQITNGSIVANRSIFWGTCEKGNDCLLSADIFDVDDIDIEADGNTYVDIAGDIMTGNLTLENISISSGNKFCLDSDTCTKYIWYNGTNIIIQG